MASAPLPSPDDEHRVIPFRRPDAIPPGGWNWRGQGPQAPSPVEDLEKYERLPEGNGEYQHRMLMNVLALLVTVALMLAGGWLATTIAEMRRAQDCYLTGRLNCTPIDTHQLERR